MSFNMVVKLNKDVQVSTDKTTNSIGDVIDYVYTNRLIVSNGSRNTYYLLGMCSGTGAGAYNTPEASFYVSNVSAYGSGIPAIFTLRFSETYAEISYIKLSTNLSPNSTFCHDVLLYRKTVNGVHTVYIILKSKDYADSFLIRTLMAYHMTLYYNNKINDIDSWASENNVSLVSITTLS